MVYVEGRETAEKILAVAGLPGLPVPTGKGKALEAQLNGPVAVYTDRRGRAFAWQIPFDTSLLEVVQQASAAIVLR